MLVPDFAAFDPGYACLLLWAEAYRNPVTKVVLEDQCRTAAVFPELSMFGFRRKTAHERLEILEKWSGWATLGIFIGIVFEICVLFAYHYKPSDAEFWLTFLANVLIGGGLLIEYFCILRTIVASREAEADKNEQLGNALNRAAAAEEALINFRTRRRQVIEPAKNDLSEQMNLFAGTSFDTGMSNFEREIGDLLWDIEEALHRAGWKQLDWAAVANATTVRRNLRPLSGMALAQNVEIEMEPAHRQGLLPAANALIGALNDIGITASEAPYNTVSGNAHAMHILVGPKR